MNRVEDNGEAEAALRNITLARANSDDLRTESRLSDGTLVSLRPIRAQDIAMERTFIEALSPSARRFRFLDSMISPSDRLLHQLVDIDPVRDVALVAVIKDGSVEREVGVARLSADPTGRSCEFAITVADACRRQGLGRQLMLHLIHSAVARHLELMYSMDAADNDSMREFATHLGFHRAPDVQDATQVVHSIDLRVTDAGSVQS